MIRVVQFELTGEQWDKMRRFVALPDSARAELNNAGSSYLTFRQAHFERKSNSKIVAELKQVSRAGRKLARLMRQLSPDARFVVTAPERSGLSSGPTPRLDALRRLMEQTRAVRLSSINFYCAARGIPDQTPGFDPSDLRWLVDAAAYISEQHLGVPFAEQSGRRHFVSAFAKAVEPDLTDGKIDNALDAWGKAPE